MYTCFFITSFFHMYKVWLYPERRESIEWLSLEDKGKILENIFCYSTKWEIPHNSYIGTIFNFMKNRIDKDKEEYEKKCKKNSDIAIEREKHKRSPKSTNVHERSPKSTRSTNSNSNSNSNVSKDTMVTKFFFQPTDEWKIEMGEFLWPEFVQSFKNPLWLVWYMILGGYKVEKNEQSVRDEIKRLKEKAEIYWYKLPTWETDRWMMKQKFDHCIEWWKNQWKEMKNVKNAFITFLSK